MLLYIEYRILTKFVDLCVLVKKVSKRAVAFKKHTFYHMKTLKVRGEKNIPKRKIICKNVYHLFISRYKRTVNKVRKEYVRTPCMQIVVR